MSQIEHELLHSSLSAVHRELAQSFFGRDTCHDLLPYFRYCNKQANQINIAASMSSSSFALPNHREIIDLVANIRNRVPYDQLRQNLSTGSLAHTGINSEAHAAVISLVLRMLMMLDEGSFSNCFSGRNVITWTQGTIDEFVQSLPVFEGRPRISCDGVKLESQFNVKNIEYIGGFAVELTTNLADHLVLREELNTVMIFHHAAFLYCHQEYIISV